MQQLIPKLNVHVQHNVTAQQLLLFTLIFVLVEMDHFHYHLSFYRTIVTK